MKRRWDWTLLEGEGVLVAKPRSDEPKLEAGDLNTLIDLMFAATKLPRKAMSIALNEKASTLTITRRRY